MTDKQTDLPDSPTEPSRNEEPTARNGNATNGGATDGTSAPREGYPGYPPYGYGYPQGYAGSYGPEEGGIDYRKWLVRIGRQWKWLVLCAVLGVAVAWWAYQSATRVYEYQATIMLKGSPSQLNIFDRNFASSSQLGGFGAEYRGYLNQSIRLGLRSSVLRTVESLPFNVHFYTTSRFRETELFPEEPWVVEMDVTHPQALRVDYQVLKQPDGSLLLRVKGEKVILHDFAERKHLVYYPDIDETIAVPADGVVKTNYCSFVIRPNTELQLLNSERDAWMGLGANGNNANATSDAATDVQETDDDKPVFFRFYTNGQLASLFKGLNVKEVEKYATTAVVTLRTSSPNKGRVFLNQHLDLWLLEEMEQKNLTAVNTLHFINQQLEVTRDSLELIKGKVEQFRRSNDVILLDEQLSEIYMGRKQVEDELTTLRNTQQRLVQLKQYIATRASDTELMAPVVMGLDSEALSAAVLKLMDIRSRLYSMQSRDRDTNPYVEDLRKEERTQLAIVDEALLQLESHNAQAMRQTERRLQGYIGEQNALPAMEQEYLELKRTFDLNDKLYSLLRTRKVETEVMKAAATADSKVLEYATEGRLVSPSPLIVAAGLVGGLALPIAIIVLLTLLDVKVHDEEEVKRLVRHPILGHILRNDLGSPLVTFDYPATPITETFRALRSSFNYLLRGRQPQVIVVTSSASGEGKSFVALNMAGLYAMAGRRTVLLGFDLRKHGLKEYLDIPLTRGISEVLIGTHSIDEVVTHCRENLDVITAGTLPPNPSDLIDSEATVALIAELRQRYDYIVIDTSPVGLVTDALPLAAMADINLFVVRPGHTLKKALAPTFHQLQKSGVATIGIVLNAIDPTEQHVSYGYGYTPRTTNT